MTVCAQAMQFPKGDNSIMAVRRSTHDFAVQSGCFDERVFRGLDWVLAEAGKRGVKVMLVLVNFWKAYGGMSQYVKCVLGFPFLYPLFWVILSAMMIINVLNTSASCCPKRQ